MRPRRPSTRPSSSRSRIGRRAVPADLPNGDDQAYAAAELVRLGYATRVTLVNATLDDALPDTWEIRGTPVGLVRLPREPLAPDRRAALTVRLPIAAPAP